MSYKIIYNDLWELSGETSQANKQMRESIESLLQRFQSFVGDGDLQGESMHSMKTYVQEVHGTLLQSIVMLMAEYDTQLLLYKDGYFNIDSNLHAELPETSFETIQKELNQALDRFISHDNSLASVGRTINDLVSFSVTRGYQINGHFSDNWINVQNLKAKIGEYEHQHEKDLNSFTEHLTSLRNLVKYYRGQSKNIPRTYQTHDIAKVEGAREFISSYQNVQTHLVASSQQLDVVIKREEGRIESLKQEAIEARKKQADSDFFTGLLIAAGGFIAIVATAGAATPIVATIGFASGAGTMLYGASKMDEATNSKKLALNGDITTKAFNPLRDTIFGRNDQLYDFVGGTFVLTSTVTSGFVAPVSNLMATGNSLARASGMVALQTAGIGAASYVGGKLSGLGMYHLSKDVFELTESQSQSNAKMAEIFGAIATGIAVAKPIDKVVNNRFGLNAKIPDKNHLSKIDDIDDSFSKINTDIDSVKLRDGIWKEKATARGKEIDELMGNNLGSNYPVIDKFEDGVATSIKSRDLTAKSYQNGNKLYGQIKRDVNQIADFEMIDWGKSNYSGFPIQQRELSIVVPNTKLTGEQINAINKAIDYASTRGVKINIFIGGN